MTSSIAVFEGDNRLYQETFNPQDLGALVFDTFYSRLLPYEKPACRWAITHPERTVVITYTNTEQGFVRLITDGDKQTSNVQIDGHWLWMQDACTARDILSDIGYKWRNGVWDRVDY